MQPFLGADPRHVALFPAPPPPLPPAVRRRGGGSSLFTVGPGGRGLRAPSFPAPPRKPFASQKRILKESQVRRHAAERRPESSKNEAIRSAQKAQGGTSTGVAPPRPAAPRTMSCQWSRPAEGACGCSQQPPSRRPRRPQARPDRATTTQPPRLRRVHDPLPLYLCWLLRPTRGSLRPA